MGELRRIYQNQRTGELTRRKLGEDWFSTNLVFDADTRIVFYKFSEIVTVNSKVDQHTDTKVGFMTPYLGENGYPCCFVDDNIVELD